MLFGRKKHNGQPKEPATIKETLGEDADSDRGTAEESSASGSAELSSGQSQEQASEALEQAIEDSSELRGPQDVSTVDSTRGYLNFGAILVPAKKDQKVRLDIDQKSKRVVSLTITDGDATIQLQAFSAPKSGGIWDEVRGQIEESVVKQKGRVRHQDGRFGKELHARVPTVLKDGRQGWRAARFIGYEGNRWFLRGVIGGRGAIDPQAAQQVETLFSRLVVSRGEEPLPPRELLPLKPPAGAKRVVVPRGGQANAQAGTRPEQESGSD